MRSAFHALLLITAPFGCSAHGEEVNPCASKGAEVHVATDVHQLTLCLGASPVRRFPVALGSGGVDKRVEGDAKTPLGRYGLGAPRPSQSFHTFIPVEYPTRSQRAAGFTGGAVGIHGPPRAFRFAGRLTVETDWTLGCVALPSDADVDTVAAFVREHQAGLRIER